MENANRDAMQERLETLEETIAFQNRVGVIALFGMLAIFSVAWLAFRPSKNMTVDSLELRDKSGTVRTRLSLAPDGSPELAMFDHQGVKLVTMGQTFQCSSALSFYDEGEARMQLSSISKGVSALRFMNQQNETQSSIFIRPDKGMGMSFASAGEGLFLGLEPDGKPGFRQVDIGAAKEGRAHLATEELERFALPAKPESHTTLHPAVIEPRHQEHVETFHPTAALSSGTADEADHSLAMHH